MQNAIKISGAIQKKAAGFLPPEVITVLLPLVIDYLAKTMLGCLDRRRPDDVAVQSLLRNDGALAAMYRRKAIRSAERDSGLSLSAAQQQALDAALRDVAREQPQDVLAGVHEMEQLDLSVFG